jgi:hypothetical protein
MYGVFVFILPSPPFLTKRGLCYFLSALKITIFCFVTALSQIRECDRLLVTILILQGLSSESHRRDLSRDVASHGGVQRTD